MGAYRTGAAPGAAEGLGRTEVIGPAPGEPDAAMFFRALRASRLLPEDEVASLEQRARADREPDPFGLLVGSGRLTRYQYCRLWRGEPAGLVIGPYHVLEEVGRGGGGQVFKARHTVLGRPVALKVVDPRYAAGRPADLFRREVAAITRLDHPNIARVYDANEADGVLYLAMEFVDGPTLHGYTLESGSVPPELGVCALMQTAHALQHAHEHGLVHRDIKPANILFPGGTPGAGGEPRPLVKLVDFGLARLSPWGEEGPETIPCPDGAAVGTPAFMAPEQIRDVHGVDIRSDLYGLGCSFYFALAGRLPFEAPNAGLTLAMHLEQEPPPLRSVCPAVPAALARIVHRLMAKNPADRYQTPADLVAALNESVLSRGGPEAGPSRPEPLAIPHEPARPNAPVSAPDTVGSPARAHARPDPTTAAEFRRHWAAWCAVVGARACGDSPPVSVEEYKGLYRALMSSARRARGCVPELSAEEFDRLEVVIEPWVTLQSLATLERRELAQVWGACRAFDERLTPASPAGSRGPGAGPLVLLCLVLAAGVWGVFAHRPGLAAAITETVCGWPLLVGVPPIVALLVTLLFRPRSTHRTG